MREARKKLHPCYSSGCLETHIPALTAKKLWLALSAHCLQPGKATFAEPSLSFHSKRPPRSHVGLTYFPVHPQLITPPHFCHQAGGGEFPFSFSRHISKLSLDYLLWVHCKRNPGAKSIHDGRMNLVQGICLVQT